MMSEGVEDVLARLPYLHHRCDLDLLVFFHRHPRVLLTSDRLVAVLGYDLKQVTGSLETLIAAKVRSEEHTSELQSRLHLVCRLLLEKKKKKQKRTNKTNENDIEPT